MSAQHTMSPDLIAFLKAWYDWATNGAPDGDPFSRDAGLCPNAGTGLRGELKDLRQMHFTNWVYPFGRADYDMRTTRGTQHECPKRLAWVRAKLVEAGELVA